MDDSVVVPGTRDVRGTLDRSSEPEATNSDSIVVACPPHPEYGGNRGDSRLRAVSDRLTAAGIDCLRFDYGPWDEGYGERSDAENAVRWAADRYERVGLFGFSFGGTITIVTAADHDGAIAASALAPTARLDAEIDAVEALDRIDVPIQIVYGTRDTTADWRPVVDRARDLLDDRTPKASEDRSGVDSNGPTIDLVEFEADHFFVGQTRKVAAPIGSFFESTVGRH